MPSSPVPSNSSEIAYKCKEIIQSPQRAFRVVCFTVCVCVCFSLFLQHSHNVVFCLCMCSYVCVFTGESRSRLFYSGPIDCFIRTVRADGISGLYRGLASMLARDIPGDSLSLCLSLSSLSRSQSVNEPINYSTFILFLSIVVIGFFPSFSLLRFGFCLPLLLPTHPLDWRL